MAIALGAQTAMLCTTSEIFHHRYIERLAQHRVKSLCVKEQILIDGVKEQSGSKGFLKFYRDTLHLNLWHPAPKQCEKIFSGDLSCFSVLFSLFPVLFRPL